jgi:hypothetical protein
MTSSKKLQSHLASSLALLRVINSDSIIDLVIHVCLENFYETSTPPNVKTYPLMNFEFLVWDIKLASLYHSSTAE